MKKATAKTVKEPELAVRGERLVAALERIATTLEAQTRSSIEADDLFLAAIDDVLSRDKEGE